MVRAWIPIVLVACASAAPGCAPSPDLAAALRIENLTTGWIDAGIAGGQHKIVPAAAFTVKNVSDRKLGTVQVNAVFRQAGNAAEWSSAFVPGAARDLAAGALTTTVVVRGERGYTGSDQPDTMLNHPQFVDAKVDVYGRNGSSNWIKIGESPIARLLLKQP